MNLIQQAEQLKNLPDQALAQMQQRPTDTPPYLVVAEMQRRANMRKAYQGAQQGTPMNQPPVAQQMAQQMQQQTPPPMQMAKGGLASVAKYFDGGFVVPNNLPEVDPTMLSMAQFPGDPRWNDMRKFKSEIPTVRDHKEYVADMEANSGGTLLKDLASKYEQEEMEMRGQKPKLSQILMQLGLGMAASRRPDFAGAIGEGGLNALQGYTQERNRTQQMADRIAEKRLRAMEGVQRHGDRVQDLAIDARRGDVAARNTAMAGNNNIELGIMRQQGAEEQAIAMAEREYARQQAQLALQDQKDNATYLRQLERDYIDRDTKMMVEQERNKRPRGGGRREAVDKPVSPIAAANAYNAMGDDYDKQASELSKELLITPEKQRPELQKRIDAIRQQGSQMRALSMEILKRALPMPGGGGPPPPPPPPPNPKMTAEEFLNRLPSGSAPSGSQAEPVKWPVRTQELIGSPGQYSDPTIKGLGALGRMIAPDRLPENREIKYR